MSCTFTLAHSEVSDMAVFCSSSILCSPGTVLRYYLNDSEVVPVVPVITGITSVFALHMRCVSIVMYLYMRMFSVSFFFLSRNCGLWCPDYF